MRCANRNCSEMADDLLSGTLTLMEFETAPEERIVYATGGFPVCAARTRYFWLCRECSRLFTIRKWDSSGLVLEPLPAYSASPGESERKAAQAAHQAGTKGNELYHTA